MRRTIHIVVSIEPINNKKHGFLAEIFMTQIICERGVTCETIAVVSVLILVAPKRFFAQSVTPELTCARNTAASIKVDRSLDGMQRAPTFMTASGRKRERGTKTWRCESKSTVTRCSRTSSALRKRSVRCFVRSTGWPLPTPLFCFWAKPALARN